MGVGGGKFFSVFFTASFTNLSILSGVILESTTPLAVPLQINFFEVGSIKSKTSVPSSYVYVLYLGPRQLGPYVYPLDWGA